MSQTLAHQPNHTLARAQLALFHTLSDQINLTPDDRRRALNLEDGVWAAWIAFMRNGSLPPAPALPDMLRRVGQVTFNLSFVAGPSSGPVFPLPLPAR